LFFGTPYFADPEGFIGLFEIAIGGIVIVIFFLQGLKVNKAAFQLLIQVFECLVIN